jgi:hypothetical protein
MEIIPELIVILGLGIALGMLISQKIFQSKINTLEDIIHGYEHLRRDEAQLRKIKSEIENANTDRPK